MVRDVQLEMSAMSKAFSDWLRFAIACSDYKTQTAFSKAIGVSQPAISMWLSGRMIPTEEHSLAIANLLHVPVSDIDDMIADQTTRQPLPMETRRKLYDIDWSKVNTEKLDSLLHSMTDDTHE
jgi:transcriptional regulator with XRE-family HTH domain